MGLPLFVAKVESDLPTKASSKSDVLAPTNGGIRSIRNRTRRVVPPSDDPLNERESRWRLERSQTWRDNGRTLRRGQRMANSLLGDSIQVIAAPSPPAQPTEDYVTYRPTHRASGDPVDQAMDEFLLLDHNERGRWSEELQELLGPLWNREDLSARARIRNLRNARAHGHNPDVRARSMDTLERMGTWTAEPRPQARHSRLVDTLNQLSRGSITGRSPTNGHALTTDAIFNLRRIIEGMAMDRLAREQTDRPRPDTSNEPPVPRGVDGLGDRQRSMSPEMWDTLLSTMTPDPEPPSVSSSFASSFPTARTQETAASSFSVPDSGPRAVDGFLPEPPCDSGRENSDLEDDAPARSTRRGGNSQAEGASAEGPPDHRLRRAHALFPGNRARLTAEANVSGDVASRPPSHYLRVGWVGQLSVGASDEQGTQWDARPREADTPAPTGHNEDDWSGMQLIVRSLARREDIPDEWWLEAGLSRTLRDDAKHAVDT